MQTFQCPVCGNPNALGEPVCNNCGRSFSYNCPVCCSVINNRYNNCVNCGTAFNWGISLQPNVANEGFNISADTSSMPNVDMDGQQNDVDSRPPGGLKRSEEPEPRLSGQGDSRNKEFIRGSRLWISLIIICAGMIVILFIIDRIVNT